MNKIHFILPVSFIFIMASCGSENSSQKNSPVNLIETDSSFFNKAIVFDTAQKAKVVDKLINFYQGGDSKTKWLLNTGKSKLFNSLLETLGNAQDYGLYPEMYNYKYLKSESKAIYKDNNPDRKRICRLDRDATAAFMLFIVHLNEGRIHDPGNKEKPWFKDEPQDIEIKKLLKLSKDETIKHTVDTLQPDDPFYRRLRDQLRKLNYSEPREIIPFQLGSLDAFKIGFKDERIKHLRNNLNQWGIEVEMNRNPSEVDSSLIESIKNFQQAFNIKVDGVPGESTLKYLNMQDKELKKLLALNLERMRWLPEGIGDNMILVNIPEYHLRVYKENELSMEMKIIVGEEMKATPVLSDTLSHIVFNPTWTVPQSIIWDEMVPKLVEDPMHFDEDFKIYKDDEEVDPLFVDWEDKDLEEKHYFRFVQQPGSDNSLGAVKFMLSNDLSIYMHDTPADVLFDNHNRDLSHGCIRLEKPFKLANYLLSDNESWNKGKMHELQEEEEPQRVNLNQRYHVQIAYLTAWVDDGGKLKLFNDIYGFDKEQLEELNKLKEFAMNAEKEIVNKGS